MVDATLQHPHGGSTPTNMGMDVTPLEGPRAVGVNFDFTKGATLNFGVRFSDIGMSLLQSMFVDNRNNSASVTFQIAISNQLVVVPPYSQAFMPCLFIGKDSLNIVGTSAGNVLVPVQFLNTYVDPLIWAASNAVITGAVTVTGTVTAANPLGVYTDKSGAIAAGGTAQTLAAVNAARKRIFIQNPSTIAGQNIAALERLFINFTTAAGVDTGASIELQPGQSFDTGAGGVTSELISVNAATTGHRWIAKELN